MPYRCWEDCGRGESWMGVNVSLCPRIFGLLVLHYDEEVIFIVIPDEGGYGFKKLDDSPGELDFIYVFHG